MPTRTSLASILAFATLVCAAPAQTDLVGWGLHRFDSRWSDEVYTSVAAGLEHTLARRPNGSLAIMGQNSNSQAIPPLLPAGKEFVEIVGGLRHSASLCNDG